MLALLEIHLRKGNRDTSHKLINQDQGGDLMIQKWLENTLELPLDYINCQKGTFFVGIADPDSIGQNKICLKILFSYTEMRQLRMFRHMVYAIYFSSMVL